MFHLFFLRNFGRKIPIESLQVTHWDLSLQVSAYFPQICCGVAAFLAQDIDQCSFGVLPHCKWKTHLLTGLGLWGGHFLWLKFENRWSWNPNQRLVLVHHLVKNLNLRDFLEAF